MRQKSSATTPPDTSIGSVSTTLHPILQAALDSLDVELEEELTRYRRQKHRQAALEGQRHIPTWTPATGTATPRMLGLQLPRLDGSTRQDASKDLDSPESSSPVASLSAASIPPQSPPLPKPTPFINPGAKLAIAPPPPQEAVKPNPQPAKPGSRSPEWEFSADDEAAIQAFHAQEGDLWQDDFPPPANELSQPDFSETPEDYLESSEELLRSIAEETPDRHLERESNLLDTLLTPLGIGSMLLLLLSSATLGYVIMHPSSLDFFMKPQPSDRLSETSDEEESSALPSSRRIPDSPNLAADEFVDLNLNTLSTVPTDANEPPPASTASNRSTSGSGAAAKSDASTPATAPLFSSAPTQPGGGAPVAIDPPASAPVEEYVAPAPVPMSDPEPVSVAPEPAYEPPTYVAPEPEPYSESYSAPETVVEPAPEVAAAPAAPSAAPAGNYYYVVTPYNGDPSLDQAREAVPDAYVRNFSTGASVQLGAFSDATKAEELVQELEGQGIPAQLYQP